MTLKFTLAADAPDAAAAPAVVVGLYEDRALTPAAARIDEKSGGALKRLVEGGDVTGKPGTAVVLFGIGGIGSPRVVVAGLGEQKKLDAAAYHRALTESARVLKGLPIESLVASIHSARATGTSLPHSARTVLNSGAIKVSS